jgi:transporter family-2 protein
MIFILITAAILIGTLMPIQAGINAELARLVKQPYLGAFISFFTGTLFLSVILLIQGVSNHQIKSLNSASPILFLGGFLGALFVGSSIFFIPKMGATSMMVAYIIGQLVMSVCMDHFGWFGVPVNPVNFSKILGLALLFVGLFMVIKKA